MDLSTPKFNKINVAKHVARHLVSVTVATVVARTLKDLAPSTEKLNVATLAGGLAGWYVADKLEPVTDKLVEDGFAKIAERKQKNTIENA